MWKNRETWRRATGVAVTVMTLGLGGVLAGPAPDSAAAVHPLLIGSEVPDATLRTPDGKQVELRSELGDDPAVIVFYRGGW